MDENLLEYKIKKYTQKLKHARNVQQADIYRQKLNHYHRIAQYGGKEEKPEKIIEVAVKQEPIVKPETEKTEIVKQKELSQEEKKIEMLNQQFNKKKEEINKLLDELKSIVRIDTAELNKSLDNLSKNIDKLINTTKFNKEVADLLYLHNNELKQNLKRLKLESPKTESLTEISEKINNLLINDDTLKTIEFDPKNLEILDNIDTKISDIISHSTKQDIKKVDKDIEEFTDLYNKLPDNMKIRYNNHIIRSLENAKAALSKYQKDQNDDTPANTISLIDQFLNELKKIS